ncbi:MAG: di-trans,poly-cis-decaprenylcistransferase [Candidatus Competibacteraceae bacterium]|nr:di-trans,poly-cis-decaprenylcistransferase [Candidatus Competibacteraceae bacterium]MCB1803937.1 di-trans,poly-cis-decaprenylcistransferase [Candidatus Competibacteraceae bacterium]MCB1812859.1 di-trans,poly-cis-decaprenylcistransferase [Candidatus Competibacteraceae bacterium]
MADDTTRSGALPRHVAIIMDGNGRWAQQRGLPRPAGHREGAKTVRRVVAACRERGTQVLTLFAFSSENWYRPEPEVRLLMELFLNTLRSEVKKLHENDIRLRVIGDRSAFSNNLQRQIDNAEALTADNRTMTLVIAANYGGRWDILQAVRKLLQTAKEQDLQPSDIDLAQFQPYLCLHDLPEPDLFIRTGGEQRISNFLLWQLAYTELYFCDQLWPDFNTDALEQSFAAFASRQRRFGKTAEQLLRDPCA